ncbi:MAG: hypothetical protein KF716_34545 [Anaerolineae bacterium]|nr:hypothetical protein [Anaerolineae bacterium]
MLETYSPYSLLTRPNPIFERERRGLTWQPSETLPLFSTTGLYVIAATGVVLFLAAGMLSREPGWNSTGRILPLLMGIYLVMQVVVSFLADLYIIVQGINVWQARHQHGQWDIVRLTPVDEEALIHTYRALIELRVWRVAQIETTLRLALPGVVVFVVALGSWLLPIVLLVIAATIFDVAGLGTVALFTALGYFLGQLGVAYLREPIWRMRIITAMSMWSAARFADPTAALLNASAYALGWRLLPVVALLGIYAVASALLTLPIGTFASGVLTAVWVGGVGFVLNRVSGAMYVRVSEFFARRVIALLRRGECA